MSLSFILNNLHFTVEIIGALVFFVMAWLAADAYAILKQARPLLRTIGFALLGVAQLLHALVPGDDLYALLSAVLFLAGLLFVLTSFFTGPKTASLESTPASGTPVPPPAAPVPPPATPPATTPAVLFLPAFTSLAPYVHTLLAILLASIAFLSFRQLKKEFDTSQRYFLLGFATLAVATLSALVPAWGGSFMVEHAVRLLGFVFLAVWVWQYLQLRLRESIILIFISLTLFISTIVTLAFSTILMSKIEAETRMSLAIDTRVIDLAVNGLLEEARAKAALLSERGDITNALAEKNAAKLEALLAAALTDEKLGFLLVTDKNGTVVLRAHALARHGDQIGTEEAVGAALIGNAFATIESSPAEKFSIRAAAPLYQKGVLVGTLVAGYQLDNVFADRMKKVTGLEMSIYAGEEIVATTALARDARTRLSGIMLDDEAVRTAVLERGESAAARVELRGEQFLASYLPVKDGNGRIIGMFSASKPQQEIIALADATNRLTLVAVISLLLVFALPLYMITRRLLGEDL